MPAEQHSAANFNPKTMSSSHSASASGAQAELDTTITHEAKSMDDVTPNDQTSPENLTVQPELDEATDDVIETSNPKRASNQQRASTTATASREHGHSDGFPGLIPVLAGGAIAAGAYFLKKRFLSSRSSEHSSKDLSTQLFLEQFRHETPSVVPAATAAPTATLREKTLVVSDRIDIQGYKTRFGSPEWQYSKKKSSFSAPIVDHLVHAGAVAIGTLPTWPLGLNPSFSNPEIPADKQPSRNARDIAEMPNPSAPKGHIHGGGEFGPAVAIAFGAADLCIAVDEVGSALIPAACCGVYAYRPTSGVLQLEGAAIASSTLGTTCLLASDPELLFRAAKALNVPGGGNDTAGIVSKYLIAEDLFALCDEELRNSAPAVVAAVKRWAGPEHAQGLSLCDWLKNRIPSLVQFMPKKNRNANNRSAGGSAGAPNTTTDVLGALIAAADAIRKWEWLRSPSGRWASNKHRHATSAVSSIASGVSENDTAANRAIVLPKEIIAGVLDADKVTEKVYSNAIAVADELSQGMRAALREGYVFVVPTTPGQAPKMSGKGMDNKAEENFRNLSEQFAALASLAGVPQVVMPMPSPASGNTKKAPLSISMVTLQRRDLLLVKATTKLGPMLKEEVEKLKASTSNGNASTSAGGGATSKQGGSGGGGGASSSRKKSGVSDENARAAEKSKEAGNAAFLAGRYNDAVKRYTEAIRYNPHEAVYFSNRAMAYLKLGRYTAAEADCDAALEIDPSMVKALLRRGSAQLAQGRMVEAKADFERVLYLEPRNKQAIEELKRLRHVGEPTSFDDY
jgi:Asp-tRNA(Asn)/Glu-tRNA(Gln) amidotransferase A subunit family amidase